MSLTDIFERKKKKKKFIEEKRGGRPECPRKVVFMTVEMSWEKKKTPRMSRPKCPRKLPSTVRSEKFTSEVGPRRPLLVVKIFFRPKKLVPGAPVGGENYFFHLRSWSSKPILAEKKNFFTSEVGPRRPFSGRKYFFHLEYECSEVLLVRS